MVLLAALPMLCSLQLPQDTKKSKNAVDRNLAYANTCKVNSEITWLTEPQPILEKAKKEGKLILFVNMLGSMSGNT
jgi:hypothetical protein